MEESTPKRAAREPVAPAEQLSVGEHVSKRSLQKWQVAALLARNVASGMDQHTKLSDEDFAKALDEALHAPI